MDKTYLAVQKNMIRSELREFENIHQMTPSERKEILKWVLEGNSIYTNPWYLYYENGYEMNYLDALRFEKELSETVLCDV